MTTEKNKSPRPTANPTSSVKFDTSNGQRGKASPRPQPSTTPTTKNNPNPRPVPNQTQPTKKSTNPPKQK